MLTADLRRDYVRTYFTEFDDADLAAVEGLYRELEEQGRTDVGTDEATCVRSADIRYVGQEHSVTVPVAGVLDSAAAVDELKAAFDAVHARRFSHQAPDEPAELVSLRVSVIGQRAPLHIAALDTRATPGDLLLERRPAALGSDTGLHDVDVVDRTRLTAGASVKGPALVEEAGSCLCLPAGAVATCDDAGNLLVEVDVL